MKKATSTKKKLSATPKLEDDDAPVSPKKEAKTPKKKAPPKKKYDYMMDYSTVDFRKNPELYQVGKGEQGVLSCQPYKTEIGQHWRFKNPEVATESSQIIYDMFLDYMKKGDFVGADMARKFLMMGWTRSHNDHEGGSLFASKKKPEDEIKLIKKKQTKEFYTQQNELIDSFLAPIDEGTPTDEDQFKVKIALYGSLATNIILFGLQITAAILSRSLALVSTSIDAFMDLLSGFILVITARARRKVNVFKFPSGKTRMEPVGIIIFSALMATVSIFLIMEGATKLVEGGNGPALDTLSIILVCIAIAAKVGLFLYCRVLRWSPTAMTLALDHRNDLVVNSFGLGMAILGTYVRWWLDPVGALIVALIILRSWVSNAYEQMLLLVGTSAPGPFLQKLTYIAMHHSPEILHVESVRAFHVGTNYYAEIDIILPRDMPLWQAHDIGESLQIKLEKNSEIERAFVHLDYEYDHSPEHTVKV